MGEDWQWALANKVIPAIEHSAGIRTDYNGALRFWFTLPKGSDKTSFTARLLNYAMAYTRRNIMCYAAAKDRDQAGLLLNAMRNEAALNPWLATHLNFRNYEVDGTKESLLRILAADAKGTAGILPDLIVLDELTQWENEEFFNQLMGGVSKRASVKKVDQCTVIVISNAGYKFDFAWNALQTAKRFVYPKGKWYIYESPPYTKLAGWMSQESIDEQSSFLPPDMKDMLYNNLWIDPNLSRGLVTREQAQKCEDPSLQECIRPEYGVSYCGAIDFGPIKDRTVLTLGHQRPDGTVQIDHMKVLQGSKERHVQIYDVEAWIDQMIERFNMRSIVIDPYQMEGTIQKYQRKLRVETFEARGGKANYEMAVTLRTTIVNEKLKWYRGCGDILLKGGIHTFVDELAELVLRPMAYGYRIDHESGRHDDRICSVGMLAVHLLQGKPLRSLPDNDLLLSGEVSYLATPGQGRCRIPYPLSW